MKFLFYKAASLISKELNLNEIPYQYNKNEKLKEIKKQNPNMAFVSLFITPEKDADNNYMSIDITTKDKLAEQIGTVYGFANNKAFCAGKRSLINYAIMEYKEILKNGDATKKDLLEKRLDFFTTIIRNENKIETVMDKLELMVKEANNISEEEKRQILDYERDDVFNSIKRSTKDIACFKIFRILAYSVLYSDKKTPFDNLKVNKIANPKYVKREAVTKNLKSCLEKSKIVYICGIRGSGKTEILKEYIRTSDYWGVMTLNYRSSLTEALENDNILGLDKIKGHDIYDKTVEYLSEAEEKYLLVVENVTEALSNDWLGFIDKCSCKVIIVSSFKPRDDNAIVVDVSKLTDEQSMNLMCNYLDIDLLSEEEMISIIRKLNHHALAITVYAKAFAQGCFEYNEIMSILETSLVSDEISELVVLNRDEKLASGHIRMLFEEKFESSLNENEKTILRIMAIMPPEGIPLKALQEYSGLKNNNPIYCVLKPLFWLDIDNSSNRIVTIHSIIRDMVTEKLKPDTNNLFPLIEKLYENRAYDCDYSERGMAKYRLKFYVFKTIKLVESKSLDKTKKTIYLLWESIISFLDTRFLAEAEVLYYKMLNFLNVVINKLDDAYIYSLLSLKYYFVSTDNFNEFVKTCSSELDEKFNLYYKMISNAPLELDTFRLCHDIMRYYSSFFYKLNSFANIIDVNEFTLYNELFKKHLNRVTTIHNICGCNFVLYLQSLSEKSFNVIEMINEASVIAEQCIQFHRSYIWYYKFLLSFKLTSDNYKFIYNEMARFKKNLKPFYKEDVSLYLECLFTYYRVSCCVDKNTALALKNEIISFYTNENFDKCAYSVVKPIIKEFNLEHDGTESLINTN